MLSARVAHLAGGCCAGRFLIRLMTAVGRVSRGSPVQTAMRNCTRDEGRSFEAGSQVLASNRCKLLSSKAIVVSVAVSVGGISRRVRLREASASEPPMNCRKRIRRCQTRGVTLPPGSARGNPEVCPSGASSESWHFVDTSPAAGAVFDASLRPAINDVPGLPRNNSLEQPRRPV
jgi:hypothetical protein